MNMMDEKHNSDVIFLLSDGKTINAHSYLLQYRCTKLYDAYHKKKPKVSFSLLFVYPLFFLHILFSFFSLSFPLSLYELGSIKEACER